MRSQIALKRAVEQFNRKHPIGTPVRYLPGIREGAGIESRTTSAAFVFCGHTAVVRVEGRSDCIALTHVRAERISAGDTAGANGQSPVPSP